MGFLNSLFGPPDIEKLKTKTDIAGLVKAAGHKDYETRRKSREALIEFKEAAGDHLLKMLREKEERRTVAASLIKEIAFVPKTGLDRLFLMLADEDWEGLVNLGRQAVPDLLQLFRTSTPDNSSALAAAWSLGIFTPEEALEPLAVCLEEGGPSIDSLAALTLAGYGRTGAERLCRSLNDPKVAPGKKIYATHALARIGPEAVPALKAVLATRTDEIAAYCAITLGACGDPGIVETVRNKKSEISNAEIQEAFELVVSAWANPPDSLIDEVDSYNSGMRIMAALSLGHLRETRAAQPLQSALEDANPDAFSAKARAISKIGDRDAIDALARHVAVSDPPKQMLAILAMSERADPSIADRLIPYQKSPSLMVRMATGLSLVSLRFRTAAAGGISRNQNQ